MVGGSCGGWFFFFGWLVGGSCGGKLVVKKIC